MKTDEFLSLLKEHPYKNLRFEYALGKQVGANYHITEIKNVTIDSVDCGGESDFWKETIAALGKSGRTFDRGIHKRRKGLKNP